MTPLNTALKAELGEDWSNGLQVLPSPDGNHLLCSSPGMRYLLSFAIVQPAGPKLKGVVKPITSRKFTVNIDGTHIARWQRTAGGDSTSNYKWQYDSKGYVSPLIGYISDPVDSVEIFSIDTPNTKKKMLLGGFGEVPINAGLTADNTLGES